jgi:type IV pilus assembly protein PilA
MGSFCAACGNSIAAGEQFCRVCGRSVSTNAPVPVPSGVAGPTSAAPAETSVKAIVSLVCGLFFFMLPLSIVAIIFGHLSLSDIRKSAGRLTGQGMAIAGLVLGYLGIAAIPVILIVAAIAIPNLLRARMAANEASAAAWVRTVNTAETAYAELHPTAGFTCTLADLAGDQLITRELASGRKNGYVLELSDCAPAIEGGPNVKFRVIAYPETRNTTGTRAFCSDESMNVKVDANGSRQECVANGSTL